MRDLSDVQARKLVLERLSEIVTGDALPESLDEEHVEELLSEHSALVSAPGSEQSVLVEALRPIGVEEEDGELQLLDLSLEQTSEGFIPENSPADYVIGERAAEGIEFPEADLEIRPVVERSSTGREAGDAVLYPNVEQDTDLVIQPLPGGVETFHVLRSPAAPERLDLQLALPEGASLRLREHVDEESDASLQWAEVVREGEKLALISPPLAWDADGERVPMSFELEGDRLRMLVEHRGEDLRYPLVADPYISVESWNWTTGSQERMFWDFVSVDRHPTTNLFAQSLEKNPDGRHAFWLISWPNLGYLHQFPNHAGVLRWFAPPKVNIFRLDVWPYKHAPLNTALVQGILRRDGSAWDATPSVEWEAVSYVPRTFCAQQSCWQGNGTDGNVAWFGLYGHGIANFGWASMGNASISMSDRYDPVVDPVTHVGAAPPSGWVGAGQSYQVRVPTRDEGFGVKSMAIFEDGEPWRGDQYASCGADRFSPACPQAWQFGPYPYNTNAHHPASNPWGLDEGITKFTAGAKDAIGRETPEQQYRSWTVRVDRSAPEVSFSGSMAERQGPNLDQETLNLRAAATDRFSGVVRTDVFLNDVLETTRTQTCPSSPGQCPLSTDWSAHAFQKLQVGNNNVRVVARDAVGNQASETLQVHGYSGLLRQPKRGEVTQKNLDLRAEAKRPGLSSVTFQFRRAADGAWSTVPQAAVRHANGTPLSGWPVALDASGLSPTLVWDVTATPAIGTTDGPVEVRAIFNGTPSPDTPVARTMLTRDGAAGSGFASSEIGPGQVNLSTGNFIVGGDDVKIAGYASDLTLTRTWVSRDRNSHADGPFGPGWLSSIAVDEAGSDYTELRDETSFAVVTASDASKIHFLRGPGGKYEPEPGYEDLSLTRTGTGTASLWRLKDLDGNETRFQHVAQDTNVLFRPSAVTQVGDPSATKIDWAKPAGLPPRVTRVTAPTAEVGQSCQPISQGCRVLEFDYATETTATGTQSGAWGNYKDRLWRVRFRTWDPATSTDPNRAMVRFSYDSEGRLRAAWDPRISPTLRTTYAYDADGLMSELKPPGIAAWRMSYAPLAGESNPGRLRWAEQTQPSGQNARTTLSYSVPLAGPSAPRQMGAADVGAWGQSDLPVEATAVFPPDAVPASPPQNYNRATVVYMNRAGLAVNTLAPGGRLSVTEHDEHRNAHRELSAENLRRALVSANPLTTSRQLDVQRTYGPEGIEMRQELGPLHEAKVPGFQNLQQVRKRTTVAYDEGAPPPVGPDPRPYHLPTTTRVAAWIPSSPASEHDVRITKHHYDGRGESDKDIGWQLRQSTGTTVDPDGLALTTRNYPDPATGLEVERRLPKTDGEGSHTTRTIYYSKAANSTHAECGGKAVWERLVCKKLPAKQPGGSLPKVLETQFEYDFEGRVTRQTDRGDGPDRITTTTYDDAGRQTNAAVTGGQGQALAPTETTYHAQTGMVSTTESTEGGVTRQISRTYDPVGRQVSYTDAEGNIATGTYDLLGRPLQATDGKALQTHSYDPVTGELTQLVDSQAGTFTAAYDHDGRLTRKTLPNGLAATSQTDAAGNTRSLTYVKESGPCGGQGCQWYQFTGTYDVHGQLVEQSGHMSSQGYRYDRAGRLTETHDALNGQGCTVRAYAYDKNSNRTRQDAYAPLAGGACDANRTGAPQTTTHAYDAADRTLGSGYEYDSYGRTTRVPAADAGGTVLQATYHVNDLVRSITQDGVTQTFHLDPADRVRRRVRTGGATQTHYYAADGDSPAWIALNATGTQWDRHVPGIDGDMAATVQHNGAIRLTITNLHNDIIAEAAPDPQITNLYWQAEHTEFGIPRVPLPSLRYGWLGAKQRPQETKEGIIRMGVRLYNPHTGRFLQVDPVEGGSANDYEYGMQDPVNNTDLDGQAVVPRPSWKLIKWCAAPLKFKRRAKCGIAFALATRVWGHVGYDKGMTRRSGEFRNAMRHCWWSALMTEHLGWRFARRVGYLYERNPHTADSRADLRANRKGRMYARRGGEGHAYHSCVAYAGRV